MLFSRLQGLGRGAARRKAGELLEEFGLSDAATKPVTQYSGGMRRRLDLAASLIAQPPLIFLDEPTTGLDPRTRTRMWNTIRRLVATGSTVLLTTQYLDEADQLADRVAVIDRGRVVAEGTPDELKASVGESSLQLRLVDAADLDDATVAVERVLGIRPVVSHEAGRLTAPMHDADRVTELLVTLREAGIRLAELSVSKPTLDEVFLALTGHGVEPVTRRSPNRSNRSNPMRPRPGHPQPTRGIAHDRRHHSRRRTRPPQPVGLRQTLSNSFAMAWRGLLKIKRTPEQLFDVTFQPVLLTVMFTYIFGGAIAGTPEDYLPFIVSGILVQTVIMTSVVTGVQLREDMAKGVFDRFRSLPIARVAPLAGALLADTVRYAIAAFVTFARPS